MPVFMNYIFLVFGAFLFIIVYVMGRKYTVPLFWFSLMMYFDPGGFVAGYGGGNIIGKLNASDFFFFIISGLYFIRYKHYFRSQKWGKETYRLLKWLALYFLYYIFIFGFLAPILNGYPNFSMFLLKSRAMFYLPFIFIYVYHFAQIDTQARFVKYITAFSLVILPLFLVSYLTGIEIVPIIRMSRFAGEETQRVWMASYGFINLSLYFSLVVLLMDKKYLRLNKNNRRKLLAAGVFIVLVLILTLTRREIIRLIAIPIIMAFIISKLERKSIFNKTGKIILGGGLIIVIMGSVLSTNLSWLSKTMSDTVLLLTTGQDSYGNTDERLNQDGGFIHAKDFINNNLLIGSGYYPYTFEEQKEQTKGARANNFVVGLNSASEVGIFGALFKTGLMGLLLSFPFYLIPLKKAYLLYKRLRRNPLLMYKIKSFDLIIVIFTFTYFIQKLVLEFLDLFGQFGTPINFAYYLVIIAVFFNSYDNIKRIIKE
jgi:hypothetical protein